jgi:hypothetical protein
MINKLTFFWSSTRASVFFWNSANETPRAGIIEEDTSIFKIEFPRSRGFDDGGLPVDLVLTLLGG